MKMVKSVLLLFVITVVLYKSVTGLTCGQTKCKDRESCCPDSDGNANKCCCFKSATETTFHCYSSSSLPVYAIVLIVIALIGIVVGAVIGYVLYRRRRRNQVPYQTQ